MKYIDSKMESYNSISKCIDMVAKGCMKPQVAKDVIELTINKVIIGNDAYPIMEENKLLNKLLLEINNKIKKVL